MTAFGLNKKAPLFAAFFVFALLITACKKATEITGLSARACEQATTPLSNIQGDGALSPMLGQELHARGIVTHVEASSGVYLEQPAADASNLTSNALFLASPELASVVNNGDDLIAHGMVAELGDDRNTITSLSEISGYRVCGSGQSLPVSRAALPLPARTREALEAMRIEFGHEMVVTNTWGSDRGLLTLSKEGVLPIPTEITRPGARARTLASENRQLALELQRVESDRQVLPAGTRVMGVSGVLGHDGSGLRLLPAEALSHQLPPFFPPDSPGEGELRVVGLNLHNYFNGDGKGSGFPTERGAETMQEFAEQRKRLSSTIELIKPDIVAVMELENDGFETNSAAVDFIADLEKGTGATWNVVRTAEQGVGDDAIAVGIFYREDKLQVQGSAQMLNSPEFERLSRVPLAQNFKDLHSGESFIVLVNHLKSKGSCPDEGHNANLGDGQGCWNLARTQAAQAMAAWALSLTETASEGKTLILGDMNAYRMEDPISAIIDSGFQDLTAPGPIGMNFSFIFRGQAGTLDYAFASDGLKPHVRMARILNINSPYPLGVDLPKPFLGSSDHDPVLVDLRFRQSETLD